MLSNRFALDRSFLPKGQLVFPSNGCLREDSYNMHWFCCNERHWVFLGTQKLLWNPSVLVCWLTCQCDAVKFRWNWFHQKTKCLFCVLLSGCSALCSSGTGPAPGTKALLGNSLMHSVMKLALGVTPDNGTIQKLAFSLLANLAMSHDCRGVLQKVSTEHNNGTTKNLDWRGGKSTSSCNPVCTILKV